MPLKIDDSRPFLAGFAAFYEREIAAWMAGQVERHRAAKRQALIVAVSGTAGLVLLVWLNFAAGIHVEEISADLAGALPVLAIAGIVFLALRPLRRLHGEVKGFLLGKVCGFLGLSYSAVPSGFPFAHFDDIGLLPGHHRRKLEDNIAGRHDGVDFTLCEARLEQRQTGSKGRTRYVEVYHGILVQLTFPKRFSGRTLVARDGGTIGNFFRGIGKRERVTLEDPRFEALFEVYGTDQVEARYLLTPTFMERIMALAATFGEKSVELAFVEDRLLVSIRVSTDQFEGGGLFQAMDDTKRIETLIEELCRIYDVIDTLQLNIRTNV